MNRKILVVEDQEDARRILRDLLTNSGYTVIEATTGRDGIDAAILHCPDLIIMDIQLPDIDGYEATRRLRSLSQLKQTPIIVATAHALNGEDKKAFSAGCDAYVAKPFSPSHLLTTIRHYLEKK